MATAIRVAPSAFNPARARRLTEPRLVRALLMVLAFAIFAAGKPFYAKEVISRTPSSF